jgi:hypothetical protein
VSLPRRESVAVEEGEIGRHEVRSVGHSDCQLGREVMLGRRNQGKEIVARSCAAHTIGSSGEKKNHFVTNSENEILDEEQQKYFNYSVAISIQYLIFLDISYDHIKIIAFSIGITL